jgi:hypothetical protein
LFFFYSLILHFLILHYENPLLFTIPSSSSSSFTLFFLFMFLFFFSSLAFTLLHYCLPLPPPFLRGLLNYLSFSSLLLLYPLFTLPFFSSR